MKIHILRTNALVLLGISVSQSLLESTAGTDKYLCWCLVLNTDGAVRYIPPSPCQNAALCASCCAISTSDFNVPEAALHGEAHSS